MINPTIIAAYEAENARLQAIRKNTGVRVAILNYLYSLLNLIETNPDFQDIGNLAGVFAALSRTHVDLLERDEECQTGVIERAKQYMTVVPAQHRYCAAVDALNEVQWLQLQEGILAELQKIPKNNHRHLSTITQCFSQLSSRLQNNHQEPIKLELVKALLVLWASKLETKIENMYQLSLSILNEKVCVLHEHPDIALRFDKIAKQYHVSSNRETLESENAALLFNDRRLHYFFKLLTAAGMTDQNAVGLLPSTVPSTNDGVSVSPLSA